MNESAKIFRLYVEATHIPVTFHGDEGQPGPAEPPKNHVAIEYPKRGEEVDLANPDERREVEIANQMLKELHYMEGSTLSGSGFENLKKLANELLTMHKQKPTVADAAEAEETLAAVQEQAKSKESSAAKHHAKAKEYTSKLIASVGKEKFDQKVAEYLKSGKAESRGEAIGRATQFFGSK